MHVHCNNRQAHIINCAFEETNWGWLIRLTWFTHEQRPKVQSRNTFINQPFISYQRNTNQISFAVVKNISTLRLYLISHSTSGNSCSLKWIVTEIAVLKNVLFFVLFSKSGLFFALFCEAKVWLLLESHCSSGKERVLFQIIFIYQLQNVTIIYLKPILQVLFFCRAHAHTCT